MSYPSHLITNSYNVLGLNCLAALSEIRKRSQFLLQLAKIDEIEHFKTDIGDPSLYRIESKIRKAQERLSGIKERLYETFFWLEAHTAVNKKVIQLISKGNCQEAITILENSKNIKNDWLSRKNLALSFLFVAFSKLDISAFKKSLELWKQIKDSQVFWDFYEKYYILHDEIGTSSSLFKDFQKEICKFLTRISGALYQLTKDPEIIGIYYNQFGHIDEKMDGEILQPFILKIRDSMNKIEEVAESNESDKEPALNSLLHKLLREYTNLCKFELCSYSPIAVLKDNIANRLRSASVTINNKDKDYNLAIFLVLQAEKLASSKTVLEEIQKDKKIFSENQRYVKNQRLDIKQKRIDKWVALGAVVFFLIIALINNKSKTSSSQKSSYKVNSFYSTSPAQFLTFEEKKIIDYLQKNNPTVLKDIRKEGYSDKEIAQYIIKSYKEKK